MPAGVVSNIHLRGTVAGDVRSLFEYQLDPLSNDLAGTKPRDLPTFQARWDEILRDPAGAGVVARVIIADSALVGSINISPQEGADSIGYWGRPRTLGAWHRHPGGGAHA